MTVSLVVVDGSSEGFHASPLFRKNEAQAS